MNKSRSLIDIFIIYAIEILCNIKVDITANINIKIVLDIAVISISYNFFYRTNLLYINLHIFTIPLQLFYKNITVLSIIPYLFVLFLFYLYFFLFFLLHFFYLLFHLPRIVTNFITQLNFFSNFLYNRSNTNYFFSDNIFFTFII